MMSLCLNIFLLCLFQDMYWSIKVQLRGAQYVRKNESVLLNCSTDFPPVGPSAEFLVNTNTYTDIRYSKNSCFSAVLKKKCRLNICDCSTEGLWFTHKYQVTDGNGFIQFTCTMKYGNLGSYSDSLNVTIVDIKSPNITTDCEFPLLTGKPGILKCELRSQLLITSIDWICLETRRNVTKITEKGRVVSTLTWTVHISDTGTTCTCVAYVYGIIIHSSIKLEVKSIPKSPKYIKEIACLHSSSVTLSCYMSGEDGSNAWTHFVNGTFLRTLHGRRQNNVSQLTIESCKPQDAGYYDCSVTSRYYDEPQKIFLIVNAPPCIEDAFILRQNRLVISVAFLSSSKNTNETVWLLNGSTIKNSTTVVQTTVKALIQTQVYDRTVNKHGYRSNLSVDLKTVGTFIILLENEFGSTNKSFLIVSSSIDLDVFVLIVTAIGIFIVTVAGAAIATRVRKFTHVIHIVDPNDGLPAADVQIYHSAPHSVFTVNLYDSTDPQYLEVIDYESQLHHSDTDLKVISSEDKTSATSNSISSGYEDVTFIS